MKFKPNDYFLKQYPDLLNTKEVGEILRICQKSVYKMIQRGELKAFCVARKTLVPKGLFAPIYLWKRCAEN